MYNIPDPRIPRLEWFSELWHLYYHELAHIPDQIQFYEVENSTLHMWGLLTDTRQWIFNYGIMHNINIKAMSNPLTNLLHNN